MNVYNLLTFFGLLVFVFAILYKLSVRMAKYLVEMELKSSSSSPFADVIFATEPTQKLSIHENVSQSEDTPEPCIENYFNSNLSIKPSILPPKQEHAPLS